MDNKIEKTILTQWQVCVEMANSVSSRRDTMNNLFVTLNTAFITAVEKLSENPILLLLGLLICLIWWIFIRNYRYLNEAKFDIITKIENDLPIQCFKDEWEIIKEKSKYIKQTNLDTILPILFAIAYVVLICLNYWCDILNLFKECL